jgi:transcription initiation factor TFIIIB Brf1 subunit/transcription initiation factor TFIIB
MSNITRKSRPVKNRDDTTKRHKTRSRTKKQLWDMFTEEIPDISFDKTIPLDDIFQKDKVITNCIKCDSNLILISEEGFLICPNNQCAHIHKNVVDQSPEWRYSGAEDNNGSDPTRCGMPINPLLKESSFACTVLNAPGMTYEMRKIKKYAIWHSMPPHETTHNNAFQYITRMAHIAGIPKMISDEAIRYHKKISEHPVSFRGTNRDGVLGSSIYIACKINNFPRTPTEISEIFKLDPSSVTKGCKNAINILNDLEKDLNNNEKTVFGKTLSVSFISRFCSLLNINAELTRLCQFISVKIEKINLMPENIPYSVAAGIIYFVVCMCQLPISKKDIKSVTKMSEVTINKCYKKIEKAKNDLLPQSILIRYGGEKAIAATPNQVMTTTT